MLVLCLSLSVYFVSLFVGKKNVFMVSFAVPVHFMSLSVDHNMLRVLFHVLASL